MLTDPATITVRPANSARVRAVHRCAGVVTFAALTAVGAAISVPLPHTPVPVTFQTLVVLLAGVTLGPRLGLASMALYLLLGSAGYHVFAGGHWGLSTVCGATGGYLMGFVLAQIAIGGLARWSAGTWRGLVAAVLAGQAIIYLCGLTWLALWLHADVYQTLALGLYPFLLGDALKTVVVVAAGSPAASFGRRVFGGSTGAPHPC